MDKSIIEALLKLTPKFCALATISPEDKAQVAFMAFAVLDTGHILMSTDLHSRKVRNINLNRNVALTIGWDATKFNYQIEGDAMVIIEDDMAHQTYKNVYYKQNPHLGAFRDIPNHVFIRVLPTWIRVSDYTVKPPLVQEFKLR